MDDNFLFNKQRIEEICSLILSKGLKFIWSCHIRSNQSVEELSPLLKRAGCQQMLFGIESGSQKILDVLQKKTTVERNSSALRKTKKNGFINLCFFTVGNPCETKEDLWLTKKFILDNKSFIDAALVSFLTPFPGTNIWEDMRKLGKIPPTDKVDWAKFHYDRIGFPVNQELSPKVFQNFYFELLSLAPPRFNTVFFRFLSDPLGVLINIYKTDKKVIFSALYESFLKQFKSK